MRSESVKQVARLCVALVGVLITFRGITWVIIGLAFIDSGAAASGGITLPMGLAGAAIGAVVALIGVAAAIRGVVLWIRGDRERHPRSQGAGDTRAVSRFVFQGGAAAGLLLVLWVGTVVSPTPQPESTAPTAGPFTEFYDSGEKKIEGQYSADGKLNGLIKGWYPGGQLKYERLYTAGDYVGGREWFANGQLGWERKDVTTGDYKEHRVTRWYESGQIRSEGVYRRTGAYGLHTGWYSTGQKACEIDYFSPAAASRLRSKGARYTVAARRTLWHPNGQLKYERVGQDDPRSWEVDGSVRSGQWRETCEEGVLPFYFSWASPPS